MRPRSSLIAFFVLLMAAVLGRVALAQGDALFERRNLAAWCIVPFDAQKRGSEERAAMLEKLGFTQFVYDYRAEHVATFDEEMEALKRHRVELVGWWFPPAMNDEARHILEIIKRHGMKKCDLWITGGGADTTNPEEHLARVEKEAARIKPVAVAAAEAGLRVGLYNHGGWFGEPENQIAIIARLRRDGVTNVGIVYNQHHGHGHVDRFSDLLTKMLPHLFCLNLNGMVPGGDSKGQKIVPLGQGELDLTLLKIIRDSAYRGPIGILNHTNEDAEVRLQDNLDGLGWLAGQLKGQSAGPRPTPKSWKGASIQPAKKDPAPAGAPALVPSRSEALGKALQGGIVLPGKEAYRQLPLTVECLVKLESARGFNILVASELKSSPFHWELYSFAGSGALSLYMPGRGGEYKSDLNICDGQWHRVSAIIEENRVRLKVDKKEVLDAPVAPVQLSSQPVGDLAIGRLVEGRMAGGGVIDEVRIARGNSNPVGRGEPLSATDATLGLWGFDDHEALHKEVSGTALSPAAFSWDRAPLRPQQWPHHRNPVNRDRIYDFYSKQALFFKGNPAADLLPPFPGLDGGTQGHWGNQNDDTWRDARWREADHGSVHSGVFRGGGLVVPKSVCVRLGEKGEMAACFDPLTATFPVVWQGGFLKLSEIRHGFVDGVKPDGDIVTAQAGAKLTQPLEYRGFFRVGNRTVFSYRLGVTEMLDAAWVEDGKFVRLRAPASEHPWKRMLDGGPAQWPEVVKTQAEKGSGVPYALDTLTVPYENPYGTLFFISDHDFLPNGDLAVCTMTGEVWLVRGVNNELERLSWKRYATGLHQPLGLLVVEGNICVLGRDQITRLHDLNGDDEADRYECLTNAQITSPSGHDYICGLQRDSEGRFYFASGNQGVCRVKPGGPVEVVATGFRNPNGIALSASGVLTTSCQEGDWTPTSMICELKAGGFYGLGGPRPGKTVEPPLIYLPRGVDNSSGGQCYVESDVWGVPRGTLLTFSCGACTGLVVLRDGASGQAQGAAWELPADFLSGAQRARFHPQDGQLYVSGMYGWGCYGVKDGCLQRVRYTGSVEPLPVAWEARSNGVMVTFSHPVDIKAAKNAQAHFAQVWNYITSNAYGSQEWSVRHPRTAGHDVLEITSVQVLEEGRKLFIEIPGISQANQLHLHVSSGQERAHDLYATLHQLGEPFTQFPGARPLIQKDSRVIKPATASPPALYPNPWQKGEKGRSIALAAALGLQFAQREIVASPGERLSITFQNPDVVPHNFVLIKPGCLTKIGDLANRLVTDPAGPARHYVPDSPDVLAYTDMVDPQKSFSIHITAPAETGNYPYLCTFPGHWMVMHGVLKVE